MSMMKKSKANGNSRAAEDPCCAVCMNDEFEEDEQGGMICIACGTQSQDFLAEGFDEDDLAVYGGGTGNIVTMRNASGKGTAGLSSVKIRKMDLVPDLLEALKLYQFVLQMVFDTCLAISNSQLGNASEIDLTLMNATYRNTLKSVWMEYMNRWNIDHRYEPQVHTSQNNKNDKRARFRKSVPCSVGAAFSRSTRFQCCCQNVGTLQSHPLFPSKPLLMGFIYLTYRIMRSDIIASDIVRWCEVGMVPYANLWENIPQRWRDSVKVDMKWFYDAPDTSKRRFITPTSILFHACSIAQVVRVEIVETASSLASASRAEMPALNAPLVARKMIGALGLPECVWENFVKITQLSTAGIPLVGAEIVEQHHEEKIMAVVIAAVKLCPRWTEWTLIKEPTSAAGISRPFPETANGVYEVKRAELPQLLAQSRRTNPLHSMQSDTSKTRFLLNGAVFSALGGNLEHLQKGESQFPPEENPRNNPNFNNHGINAHRALDRDMPRWKTTAAYTSTALTDEMSLHGESLVTEDLSLKDRRHLAYMNGVEPHNTRIRGAPKAAYIAYTRYENDRTSLCHLPYLTLLERCAKYLYVNPQLLHDLVAKLDAQIVALAFTKSSNASKMTETEDISSTSHVIGIGFIKPRKARTAAQKAMLKLRKSSDEVLPKQHKQALTELSLRAKGEKRLRGASETAHGVFSDDSSSESSVSSREAPPHRTKVGKVRVPKPFAFNPLGHFADVESCFGGSAVIAREVEAASKPKRGSKRQRPESSVLPPAPVVAEMAPQEGETIDRDHDHGEHGGTPSGAESSATSGYDTEPRTLPRGGVHHIRGTATPRPLAIDFMRAYNTSQANQPSQLSQIATRIAFTPLPAGHKWSEDIYIHTPSRSETPQMSAMEALDRLVSAQDSDSSVHSQAGTSDSEDEFVATATAATAAAAGSSAAALSSLGRRRGGSFSLGGIGLATINRQGNLGASSSSSMSASGVTARPVVSMKRPRQSVQFQN